MKVELKVREGGVVSPARRQLLSALRQTLSTMSLYCVKVSLKVRADAALSPIYAPKSELYHEIVFYLPRLVFLAIFLGGTIPHTFSCIHNYIS